MPTFKCKDIGYQCTFETSSENLDTVITKANEHVRKMHGGNDIPPEGIREIRARWAAQSHKK